MRTIVSAGCGALMASAFACGGGAPRGAGQGEGEFGTLEAALAIVPGTVRCVQVIMTGGGADPSYSGFDVQPGASSKLNLGVIPAATYTFAGNAYDSACASITATVTPSWISDPVSVAVVAAQVTNVKLTLHPATAATATIDFAPRATAIVMGGSSTYALMAGGTVRAWGANDHGQLGDGTRNTRLTPINIPNLTNVIQLAAGDKHACALLAGGSVTCWGRNHLGQLGLGSTGQPDTLIPGSPVSVRSGTIFIQIAAGGDFTCGVISDNYVLCWGDNADGQLGRGPMPSASGQAVPVLSDAIEVAAYPGSGARHTCARTLTGSVACWGSNGNHAFCTGPSTFYPTSIGGGVYAVAGLALGLNHTCFAHADGSVQCCGENTAGTLGDGTRDDRITKTFVATSSRYTQIAAGLFHTCGVTAAGGVECWGSGTRGQTGDGSGLDRLTPIAARGLTGAALVAAAPYSTCALLTDATPRCWGANESGQLGDGTRINRPVPSPIAW